MDKFCYVFLNLDPLVNFSLCKYFKYFGLVNVDVNNVESVDKFKLFFNDWFGLVTLVLLEKSLIETLV